MELRQIMIIIGIIVVVIMAIKNSFSGTSNTTSNTNQRTTNVNQRVSNTSNTTSNQNYQVKTSNDLSVEEEYQLIMNSKMVTCFSTDGLILNADGKLPRLKSDREMSMDDYVIFWKHGGLVHNAGEFINGRFFSYDSLDKTANKSYLRLEITETYCRLLDCVYDEYDKTYCNEDLLAFYKFEDLKSAAGVLFPKKDYFSTIKYKSNRKALFNRIAQDYLMPSGYFSRVEGDKFYIARR